MTSSLTLLLLNTLAPICYESAFDHGFYRTRVAPV